MGPTEMHEIACKKAPDLTLSDGQSLVTQQLSPISGQQLQRSHKARQAQRGQHGALVERRSGWGVVGQ